MKEKGGSDDRSGPCGREAATTDQADEEEEKEKGVSTIV